MSIFKINLISLLWKPFTEENDCGGGDHHPEAVNTWWDGHGVVFQDFCSD
jgi:hypothetical protein